MGIIRMGPPQDLIFILRDSFDVSSFVETGTFKGETAVWASKEFKQVYTIELSKSIYQEVTAKYGHIKNIEFLFGHTKEKLSEVVSKLRGSAIFWLDAHWSGGETYGESDECPLLEEVEVINRCPYDCLILIDDARFFLSPPPYPHRIEQWPDIAQLVGKLKQKSCHVVIFEDVIIAVPLCLKELMVHYCQERATQSWKIEGQRSIKKGMRMVVSGVKKIIWKK